jgi:hypothetical protein
MVCKNKVLLCPFHPACASVGSLGFLKPLRIILLDSVEFWKVKVTTTNALSLFQPEGLKNTEGGAFVLGIGKGKLK